MNSLEPIEVGVQEGYAIWSEFYDSEENPLISIEEKYLKELLPEMKGTRILDVGAGTGRYALKFARQGCHVTALDGSKEMLSAARNTALAEGLDIDFISTSIENSLPMESSTFDMVICALVLCHIASLDEIISEFGRVITRSGTLLITDLHPDSIDAGNRTEIGHEGISYQLPNISHTRSGYLKALENSGFELVKVHDIPTKESPVGIRSDKFMEKFGDVNFCFIALARKL